MLRQTLFKPIRATKQRSIRVFSQRANQDLQSSMKSAQQYPAVGMIKVNEKQFASCILVGDRFALTNGHCVPGMWWKNKFEVFFSQSDIAVDDVFFHPMHQPKFTKVSDLVNDVALLTFKRSVRHVQPAQICFDIVHAANGCDAVGYPKFFNDPTENLRGIKIASKQACYNSPYFQTRYAGVMESKTGYKVNVEKYEHEKSSQYALGINYGMSGGGVFWQKKLIALCLGDYNNEYNLFVALSNHTWLNDFLQQKIDVSRTDTESSCLDNLKSLAVEKIDPEATVFFAQNRIHLVVPVTERLRCSTLLVAQGFKFVYSKKNNFWEPAATFILLEDSFTSATQKLEQMKDYLPDIEREEALCRHYFLR